MVVAILTSLPRIHSLDRPSCLVRAQAICSGPRLQPELNYLVDICAAERALHAALDRYNLRNLDEHEDFSGRAITCERVAHAVWTHAASELRDVAGLTTLCIIVRENDLGHVQYEQSLGPVAPPETYGVSARGRFMAARSLHGARFGEAEQRVHGGTFVVDALFTGERLDECGHLLDASAAEAFLCQALAPLHDGRLDELAACGAALGGVPARPLPPRGRHTS